ncbi:hypothetical protein [Streptomyces indicus]|nr:hypothetical protein [Streptomyces indicus]
MTAHRAKPLTAHRVKKAPRRWRGTLPLTVGACVCALALGLPGVAAAHAFSAPGPDGTPPAAGPAAAERPAALERPALPERPRKPGRPSLPDRPSLPERPAAPEAPSVPVDLEDLMEAVEGLSASPLTNLGVADPFWLAEIDREIETVLGEEDGGQGADDWPVGPARIKLKKEIQRLQEAALNGDVLTAADAKTKIPKLTDELLQAAGLGSFLDQLPPPPEPGEDEATEPADPADPTADAGDTGTETGADAEAEETGDGSTQPPVLPPPVPSTPTAPPLFPGFPPAQPAKPAAFPSLPLFPSAPTAPFGGLPPAPAAVPGLPAFPPAPFGGLPKFP